MFLDRGKKSGHPEEIHTGTGRTYYFHQFNSEMTATPLEMPNINIPTFMERFRKKNELSYFNCFFDMMLITLKQVFSTCTHYLPTMQRCSQYASLVCFGSEESLSNAMM